VIRRGASSCLVEDVQRRHVHPVALDDVNEVLDVDAGLADGNVAVRHAVYRSGVRQKVGTVVVQRTLGQDSPDLVVVNVRQWDRVRDRDACASVGTSLYLKQDGHSPPRSFLRTMMFGGFLFRRMPKPSSSDSMIFLSPSGLSTSSTMKIRLHVRATRRAHEISRLICTSRIPTGNDWGVVSVW
jgi:hypothetical protein